jgi:hypothetical protein
VFYFDTLILMDTYPRHSNLMPIYNYIPYIKMENQFHHIFNKPVFMALLIVALAGLVSCSYISSAFAPGGTPWQKIQKNSILNTNQTNSSSGSCPPGVQTFASCNLGNSQGQVNNEDIGSTHSGKTK